MSSNAPYTGIAGVRAAYERFKYWIGVDLPREWDELNALLGLLGQAPATPPPVVNPPPPPPPPPANGPGSGQPFSDYAQAAYDRSALSPQDQQLYDYYLTLFPPGVDWTQGPLLGTPFTGAPQAFTDAAIALGLVVVHQPPPPDTSGPLIVENGMSSTNTRIAAVRAAPADVAAALYPGWEQWVYGTSVNWD